MEPMDGKNENDLSDEETSRHPSFLISSIFDSDTSNAIKYNSVEDIIQKYKHKKRCSDQFSNYNLCRNVGNHALFPMDITYQNPVNNVFFGCNNDEEQLRNNIVNYSCNTNQHCRNKFTCSGPKLTSNEKVYQDKTTYCRPIINYYNEQFLYKTMERNARLKNLVKKLAIARQRQKETVSWNNFINDLKTKHGLNFESQKHITINNEHNKYITPEIIDDYYNTRFSFVKSKPCRRLLEDFYGTYDESQSNLIFDRRNENQFRTPEVNTHLPHNRDSYCYPTSSQGRLIMERRKREKESLNPWLNNLNRTNPYKIFARKKINNGNNINKQMETKGKNCYNKNSATQTDVQSHPDFAHNIAQDKATNTINFDEVQMNKYLSNSQDIKKSSNSLKEISLTSIDNKLETLIESLNILIEEVKINKINRRKNQCSLLKCQTCNKDVKVGTIDIINVRKVTKNINCERNDITEETASVFDPTQSKLKSTSKIDKTLKGLDVFISKSLHLHETYRNQSSSVQIDSEIPTKDTSTEVSKSLSKQDLKEKENTIEEIYLSDHIPLQRMTIAVNTDPLSLLGLIRISTDTIKQLLSYMPNIDYYSYLSLLQFPQARKVESHYVCNICGADFNKPSQLSDHIRSHDLGKTRDCCVCRHVLDLARKYPGLFRCQYCGQLFARAYCCELHQESCAKRFGKHHDVKSSLVLLR